jgi:hypothetical protein
MTDMRAGDDGRPALDAADAADMSPGDGQFDVDAGGRDGGPTGPWWPYTNQHGCASAGVPARIDRPAFSDPGSDLPPIYLALSRLRAGTTKDDPPLTPDDFAWQDVGFDFDKRCTRSATCEVDQMQVSELSCANSNLTPFDGNQCRDNELGKLLKVASLTPTVGEYFGLTERDWNCELHRGGFTIMFKISRYNGRNNDQDVRLDMYTSTGLQRTPNWTCRATIDAQLATDWHTRAPWISTDTWKIAQRSIDLAAPDPADPNEVRNSKSADPAAYVRGGYLYAELPDSAEFWLNGENTAISGTRQIMHRAILVGQLIRGQDDLWTIDNGILEFVTTPGEQLQSFQEVGFCDNIPGHSDQHVRAPANDAVQRIEHRLRLGSSTGHRHRAGRRPGAGPGVLSTAATPARPEAGHTMRWRRGNRWRARSGKRCAGRRDDRSARRCGWGTRHEP